jgi:hypothetical protein
MCPIRQVMVSPCLSAAGIRFSILPSPAGDLDLPRGWLTVGFPVRLHRGLHVPHEGDSVGVGAFFTPGASVFLSRGRNESPDRLRSNIAVSTEFQQSCGDDACKGSLVTFTRPTFAWPWFLRSIRTSLGLSRQLHTNPLPVSHVPVATGSNTIPSPFRTTPLKRLRVAPFLTTLYVMVDDFCHSLSPRRPGPEASLSESEVLTLAIFARWSRFNSERDFYRYTHTKLRNAFPTLPGEASSQFNRLVRSCTELIEAFTLHLASLLTDPRPKQPYPKLWTARRCPSGTV